MESLTDEIWDVVIAGTSLPQSLLALSLSRSDLKVLHVDKNNFYGGDDAGLSLDEAEEWVKRNNASSSSLIPAHIDKADDSSQLRPSRNYTLSLSPQIIYARSAFLPTLVSSQLHSQLEFQAVGSFFVLSPDAKIEKIPSNREDVFADDTISIRDKRKLMGLLRYVTEQQDEERTETASTSLGDALSNKFKLSRALQDPILALSLSTDKIISTDFDFAVGKLRRHFQSSGYFGPGLGAVTAKYGSNAEIAQVACRACAVGGAIYLLGQGLKSVDQSIVEEPGLVQVTLNDDTKLKTRHVIGMASDLPIEKGPASVDSSQQVLHRISIVSHQLSEVFAAPSENGPVPAAAVVLAPDTDNDRTPIYMQLHSDETGECAKGQCIIYSSVLTSSTTVNDDQVRLTRAAEGLLQAHRTQPPITNADASDASPQPQILWTLTYTTLTRAAQSSPTTFNISQPLIYPSLPDIPAHKVLVFPQPIHDIAFDDSILKSVEAAWELVLGERAKEYDFLKFAEREGEGGED